MPLLPDPDERLYEELFVRFHRPVFKFFLARGFSREGASDLTQDTFVRILKGLPSYRQEAHHNWVFKIAANVWKNKLRAEAAHKRSAPHVPLDLLSSMPIDAGAKILERSRALKEQLTAERLAGENA